MKKALICGAGGFIGGHLALNLKKQGYWIRGVDVKNHEFFSNYVDDFILDDLRNYSVVEKILDVHFDEIYQLAADMGGAGYINTNLYDADVMHNSVSINNNILRQSFLTKNLKIFFSSSACVYNEELQKDNKNPDCREESAYPAFPDSEYGWEKLFSERMYLAYNKQHGMQNKIARFHNIFGPYGTWQGGKEKSPAAICRKIAMAKNNEAIDIWGDGEQTRSYLFIDECIEGINQLMNNDFSGPVNIGAEHMISINQLVDIIATIAGKNIYKNYIQGPTGVRGRTSNNDLIRSKLNWAPVENLINGLTKTYIWIEEQVKNNYEN